jgi:diaminohydroxyphosphoribosylaminopyrimidine deaminase/5-amino-6-(5-phosphoribosylamino)uracil reductase
MTKTETIDNDLMCRAIVLASRGLGRTRPNPPVGAVVARGRRVVGEGYHRRAGSDHAEIAALRAAGAAARGATLYVTLEPCCTHGRTPPCTEAIIAAGVCRVVIACSDPNPLHDGKGLRALRRAGITVTKSVCSDAGLALIRPFAKWITTGKPYVTLKLGMSIDGRIGDADRCSRWITGGASRKTVMSLRSQADAILVGSGTGVTDNPGLLPTRKTGVRPFRVIADSAGKLPLTSQCLVDGNQKLTIIATTSRCSQRRAAGYAEAGATVWQLPTANGHVSLPSMFSKLGKAGVMHVLCEGGGELAAALVRRGLVDEFLFMIAPKLLGGAGVPAIGGAGWPLANCPGLRFVEHIGQGNDIMVRAVPVQE